MKILKPGKVEQRKFVCEKCGCEFVASMADDVYHPFDDNDTWTRCPYCGEDYWWRAGELYEEPAPTQTDRERLYGILLTANPILTASELANFLVENGVTFKEG